MKNVFGVLRSRGVKVSVAATAATVMLASQAQAALPTAATDALAAVGTGITDTEAAVWPYIGAALAAGIIIKLVKRFAGKI